MICQSCVDGRESECWGVTKHKTWCDSQHYSHDTVILQSQFCKHLRASETYCPTCGKVFDGENNQVEQPEDDKPLDFGYLSLPEETQRDIEDNYITDEREDEDGPGQNNYIY